MSYMLYPHIYKVTDVVEEEADFGHNNEQSQLMVKPLYLPCRGSKLNHNDVFIIDDGSYLTLLIGYNCDQDFCWYILGV